MNGTSLVLGRGPSPSIVDSPNLANLTGSTLLNSGFQSLSSSTSPILSQGAGNYNKIMKNKIIYLFFIYFMMKIFR